MHPLIVKILRMILLFAAAFLLLFAFVGFFMGDFLISLMFALPGAYLIYLVIIKPRSRTNSRFNSKERNRKKYFRSGSTT